jgi:hypothetical protein
MSQYQDHFKNIFLPYRTTVNGNGRILLPLISPYLWKTLHKVQRL